VTYVWVKQPDGTEIIVNAELLRLGYAQILTVPPNLRHQDLFLKLEREEPAQCGGPASPARRGTVPA
jgi:micrococcal nuclease